MRRVPQELRANRPPAYGQVAAKAPQEEVLPLWRNDNLVEKPGGRIFADRGCIGKTLFADGIHLVTRLKKGMQGGVRTLEDMVLLRKRAIIETVNDELKNIAQIEHSRHLSLANFLSNTFAAFAAFCQFPKKPSIDVFFSNSVNDRLSALF